MNSRIVSKNILNVSLQGLLLVFVFCSCNEKIENRPNIIYVLADDMGYGDVAAFNVNSKIPTPHLDQLAAEGMMFTDAHTSSSVCTPTRYGILTGRYNWRSRLKNGVLTGKSKALIPDSRRTVASMLQEHGYQTGFIGKWHLGWDWALIDGEENDGEGWNSDDFKALDFSRRVDSSPKDRGFEYSYGFSGSLDMAPYVYVENSLPTSIPDTVTENTGKYSWWRKGPTGSDFDHQEVTPHLFEKAQEYVKTASTKQEPFYLYLALPSPHTPILPSKNWEGRSGINPYADFVMMIDDYIGQLLNTVQESGIEDNTIVVFTTDNGCSPAAKIEELIAEDHFPNGPYRGHKADIYEGGHRVPFIIKWPEKIQAQRKSDEIICTTDFYATCAAIVGYELKDDEGEDSYNLLPILENTKEGPSPLREATVHHSINGSFAIRQGDWKLIMCPGSGGWSFPKPNDAAIDTLPSIQLYNLRLDPEEQKNMQGEYPSKVKNLKELLVKYIQQGRSTPGLAQQNDEIDFEWKQLRFIEG